MIRNILLVAITVSISGISTFAQIDEARMNRDVKIMQQALQEMFNDGKREYMFSEESVFIARSPSRSDYESKYIPGLGIMLHAPSLSNTMFIRHKLNWDVDDIEKAKTQLEEQKEIITDLLKTFLRDYGDLARQLPEEEYVMIQYVATGEFETYINNYQPGKAFEFDWRKIAQKILVKVSRNDIDEYRSGDLSEEEFYSRIETTSTSLDDLDTKEYKVFAKILESLYENNSEFDNRNEEEETDPRFEQSRFVHKTGVRNQVEYELLNGYGAIYRLKLGYSLEGYSAGLASNTFEFSTTEKGNRIVKRLKDGQIIVIEGDEGDREEEEEEDEIEVEEELDSYLIQRDERIEDIYEDQFMEELKQYMVEYGRTLRSLKSDEFLVITVELPACYECDLPATIELKVKREVMDQYEENEISLDDAIEEIKVTTSGKASEQRDLKSVMGQAPRATSPARVRVRTRNYRNDE